MKENITPDFNLIEIKNLKDAIEHLESHLKEAIRVRDDLIELSKDDSIDLRGAITPMNIAISRTESKIAELKNRLLEKEKEIFGSTNEYVN